MMLVLLLIIGIVLILLSVYLIDRHGFEETEEAYLREARLVSPSLRLVVIVAREYLRSFSSIVVFFVLVTSSLIAVYTTTTQILSTEIEFVPDIPYNVILIDGDLDSLVKIHSLSLSNYIVIVQLYDYLEIDVDTQKRKVLPLFILCKGILDGLPKAMQDICKSLNRYKDVVIMHGVSTERYIKMYPNLEYMVMYYDLSKILELEVLPNVFIVHTLGAIGGRSIKLEKPETLIVMKYNLGTIENLCRGLGRCHVKVLVLIRDRVDVSDMLSYCDILGLREGHKVVLKSFVVIPSFQSILGVAISVVLSILVALAASSGLIEKIVSLSNALIAQGVSSDILRVSIAVGLLSMLGMLGIPFIIAMYMVYPVVSASAGLLTYTISILTLSLFMAYRSIPKVRIWESKVVVKGASYAFKGEIELGSVVSCLRSMLERDEFFVLNEVEILPIAQNRYLIRFELLYRYAMAVIVSVEVDVTHEDNTWIFNVSTDVWSYEELEKKRITSIASLAQARISGGIRVCIET